MKKINVRSDDEKEEHTQQPVNENQPVSEQKKPRKIPIKESVNDNESDSMPHETQKEKSKESSGAIEIKINFPSLKKTVARLKPTSLKGVILLIVFTALLVAGGYYVRYVHEYFPWEDPAATEGSTLEGLIQNPEDLPRGNPTFEVVTPNGETLDADAWSRISPEGNDPVYAYTDAIGEVTIAVSQQPLPKQFEDDPKQQLNDLAVGFGATEKISVENTEVYIGTAGNGPQSVLFSKSGLLVLIKSNDVVSTSNWAQYIRSLQP